MKASSRSCFTSKAKFNVASDLSTSPPFNRFWKWFEGFRLLFQVDGSQASSGQVQNIYIIDTGEYKFRGVLINIVYRYCWRTRLIHHPGAHSCDLPIRCANIQRGQPLYPSISHCPARSRPRLVHIVDPTACLRVCSHQHMQKYSEKLTVAICMGELSARPVETLLISRRVNAGKFCCCMTLLSHQLSICKMA